MLQLTQNFLKNNLKLTNEDDVLMIFQLLMISFKIYYLYNKSGIHQIQKNEMFLKDFFF